MEWNFTGDRLNIFHFWGVNERGVVGNYEKKEVIWEKKEPKKKRKQRIGTLEE